jgi:hypothetical protein
LGEHGVTLCSNRCVLLVLRVPSISSSVHPIAHPVGDFYRKEPYGWRSRVMGKSCLASAYKSALSLFVVTCAHTDAQTTTTGSSNVRGSHKVASCIKSFDCPSGQRCGFMGGCESKGKCIVPSGDNCCIDPGGRCGCDARPVDIFCAVGSRTEFASALQTR